MSKSQSEDFPDIGGALFSNNLCVIRMVQISEIVSRREENISFGSPSTGLNPLHIRINQTW